MSVKTEIEKLEEKELSELSLAIGEDVRNILDKAADDINVILSKYNMEAKIQIEIKQKQ